MFEHEDSLGRLAESDPLGDKLASVHRFVQRRHEFVDRIAVAVHDPETDLLKTFVASSVIKTAIELRINNSCLRQTASIDSGVTRSGLPI